MVLKENYKIDENCYLIICPTDLFLLNKTAMENLIEFLTRKYIKRAVVLSLYSGLEEFCPQSDMVDVRFHNMDKSQIDCILKYYRLTQFAPNIVVVSLEEPFGSGNIIGKKEITLEDYVKDAIYV